MRYVIAIIPVVLLARSASANECNAYIPHTQATDVPLGCRFSVIAPPSQMYQPKVTTTRFDPHTGQPSTIDVTGTVTRVADIDVPVEMYHYVGCDLVDQGPQPVGFAKYDVELVGVEVGDVLAADGAYGDGPVKVVAAATCPAFVAPQLACADPLQTCADAGFGDEVHPPHAGGGCSTGGAGGLGVAFALLAMRRRRI